MQDEQIKDQNEQTQNQQGPEDLVAAIEELKATTIPKEKYEQLQQEHKKLIKAYVDGSDYQLKEADKQNEKSIEDLRIELSEEDITNLEYAKRALALRAKVMEENGVDPFLPYGAKIAPTEEDEEKAENVAKVLQECIDYAEDDPSLFIKELNRRMIDTGPIRKNKRK